jgi:FlaA1/EpsC-like NDP-sugar epimerase
LHEELVSEEEESIKTMHDKITMVKSPPVDWPYLRSKIEEVTAHGNSNDPAEVLEILNSIISTNSAR